MPFCLECCSPRYYDGPLLPFTHVPIQMSTFQTQLLKQYSLPTSFSLSSWPALFSFQFLSSPDTECVCLSVCLFVFCVSLLLKCKIQEYGNFCLIHLHISNAWNTECLAHCRYSSAIGCIHECDDNKNKNYREL